MKLCLVSLNENRADTYPMGILALMTYVKKKADFPVELALADANFDSDLFLKVKESRPDVVGISAMAIEYSRAIKLAKKIKEELKVPIILGGVHISTLPTSLHDAFDFGVMGEGEETLLDLLKLFNEKKKFAFEDFL